MKALAANFHDGEKTHNLLEEAHSFKRRSAQEQSSELDKSSYDSQIIPSCIHQVDDSLELASADTSKNQDVAVGESQ